MRLLQGRFSNIRLRLMSLSNNRYLSPKTFVCINVDGEIPMDQLGAIRAFVRVVEAGSFAKAADTMGAPRSTVSKLVQDLEASLSLKLLERTTRSVNVTPEGVAYYERAIRLIADFDEMNNEASRGRLATRGKLRVDVGVDLRQYDSDPSVARILRALSRDRVASWCNRTSGRHRRRGHRLRHSCR